MHEAIVIQSGIPRGDIEEWLNTVGKRVGEESWIGQNWKAQVGPQRQIPTGPITLPRTKVEFTGECRQAIVDSFRLRFLSAGG
jgi:hypothetical protein